MTLPIVISFHDRWSYNNTLEIGSLMMSSPSAGPIQISEFLERWSIPLNDFSSETPEPIFFKLHVEPSDKGELKICTNGQGLLVKMAAMPIYGKNT